MQELVYHTEQFEFCSLGVEELVRGFNERLDVIRKILKKPNKLHHLEWQGLY